MESGKKVTKIVCIGIAVMFFGILMFNTIITEKCNKRFAERVSYNSDRQLYCEYNDDYYISAGKMSFFGYETSCAIQMEDVFPGKEEREVLLTLQIWTNKLGKYEYAIGLEDKNADNEIYGGCIFIEANGYYIPENRYDQKTNERMKDYLSLYKEKIDKMMRIANERWELGLSTEGIQ